MLSDHELEQYSRQLMLPDFDLECQERLRDARVLVAGCGGLGSPLALYLAAAGVGTLVVADGDTVERSNLQRQILHGEQALGTKKVLSAKATLAPRYPACQLELIGEPLRGALLDDAVSRVDLVADGTDNYPTRYAINRACIASGTRLVSAAAARTEGQLMTFEPGHGGGCYRCLYPQEGAEQALSCRDNGVLGPVVGVLGSLQALEVIKMLSGWGETLRGRLLIVDLQRYAQTVIDVPRRPGCPDCS